MYIHLGLSVDEVTLVVGDKSALLKLLRVWTFADIVLMPILVT